MTADGSRKDALLSDARLDALAGEFAQEWADGEAADGSPARCKWCGCFVARDTEPTTRRCLGYVDDVKAWRVFSQVLCPSCAESWSRDLPWNQPVGGAA